MYNHEIELKYRIKDASKIRRLLDKKCVFQKKEKQSDEVMLFQKDSFDNFVQGEAVMRVRVLDERCKLTMKKYLNPESSLEHECEISSKDEAIRILHEIGFKTVVKINKIRETYFFDDATIALDKVEGLGNFVEIEIVCSEEKKDDAIVKLKQVSAKLGLREADIEPLKYDALIVKNRPRRSA